MDKGQLHKCEGEQKGGVWLNLDHTPQPWPPVGRGQSEVHVERNQQQQHQKEPACRSEYSWLGHQAHPHPHTPTHTIGVEGFAVRSSSGEGHGQSHVLEDGDLEENRVLTAFNVARLGVRVQGLVPEG